MKEVIHFKSQEDRMAYLKGGFEEITPKKVSQTAENEDLSAENDEKSQKTASKSKKTASKSTKSKKTTKKGAKKDEIQAE